LIGFPNGNLIFWGQFVSTLFSFSECRKVVENKKAAKSGIRPLLRAGFATRAAQISQNIKPQNTYLPVIV
jgi:hypothetical protein